MSQSGRRIAAWTRRFLFDGAAAELGYLPIEGRPEPIIVDAVAASSSWVTPTARSEPSATVDAAAASSDWQTPAASAAAAVTANAAAASSDWQTPAASAAAAVTANAAAASSDWVTPAASSGAWVMVNAAAASSDWQTQAASVASSKQANAVVAFSTWFTPSANSVGWATTLGFGNVSGANDALMEGEQRFGLGHLSGPVSSVGWSTARTHASAGPGSGLPVVMGSPITNVSSLVVVKVSGIVRYDPVRDPSWGVLHEVWDLLTSTRIRTILNEGDGVFSITSSSPNNLDIRVLEDLVSQTDARAMIEIVALDP